MQLLKEQPLTVVHAPSGRSVCSQGGLKEGLLVELSNGGMALVVKADEETVVLDANNMVSLQAVASCGAAYRYVLQARRAAPLVPVPDGPVAAGA
jgi:hypothetical protein